MFTLPVFDALFRYGLNFENKIIFFRFVKKSKFSFFENLQIFAIFFFLKLSPDLKRASKTDLKTSSMVPDCGFWTQLAKNTYSTVPRAETWLTVYRALQVCYFL